VIAARYASRGLVEKYAGFSFFPAAFHKAIPDYGYGVGHINSESDISCQGQRNDKKPGIHNLFHHTLKSIQHERLIIFFNITNTDLYISRWMRIDHTIPTTGKCTFGSNIPKSTSGNPISFDAANNGSHYFCCTKQHFRTYIRLQLPVRCKRWNRQCISHIQEFYCLYR